MTHFAVSVVSQVERKEPKVTAIGQFRILTFGLDANAGKLICM